MNPATGVLVILAAAAMLFAAGLLGVRWLHEHVQLVWRQRRAQIAIAARTVPAIRSHRPAAGAPRAIGPAPRVIPGEVLRTGDTITRNRERKNR